MASNPNPANPAADTPTPGGDAALSAAEAEYQRKYGSLPKRNVQAYLHSRYGKEKRYYDSGEQFSPNLKNQNLFGQKAPTANVMSSPPTSSSHGQHDEGHEGAHN